MAKLPRILIVEHGEESLNTMQAYFADRGFEVEARSNTREGLDLLRERRFDLLLADLTIMGNTGFDLITTARAMLPGIGIILMIGPSALHSLSEALVAGADGYLTKPFTVEKLSLIFEEPYWRALSRSDWWEEFGGPY